eukprot:g22927.t1
MSQSELVEAIQALPPALQILLLSAACIVSMAGYDRVEADGGDHSRLELVDLPGDSDLDDDFEDEDDGEYDEEKAALKGSRRPGEGLGITAEASLDRLQTAVETKKKATDFDKATENFDDFIDEELKKSDARIEALEKRLDPRQQSQSRISFNKL